MEAEAALGSASALAPSVINLRVSSASVTLPVHVLSPEHRENKIPSYSHYPSQSTSQGQQRESVRKDASCYGTTPKPDSCDDPDGWKYGYGMPML